MGPSGPAWLLYRAETPEEAKSPKKKEGNCETGSTHRGLRRGHHGSAGSSSPIEEGKQILITSSTPYTKASEKQGQEGWQRERHRLQQLMKAPAGAFPQRGRLSHDILSCWCLLLLRREHVGTGIDIHFCWEWPTFTEYLNNFFVWDSSSRHKPAGFTVQQLSTIWKVKT